MILGPNFVDNPRKKKKTASVSILLDAPTLFVPVNVECNGYFPASGL